VVPAPVLVSFEGALVAPPLGGAAEPESTGGFTAPAGAPELIPAPPAPVALPVAPPLMPALEFMSGLVPEVAPAPMSELDPDVPMLPDMLVPLVVAPVLEGVPVLAAVLAEAPVVAAIDEPDHQSRLARCFGEARM
jgi:hypothetical protein